MLMNHTVTPPRSLRLGKYLGFSWILAGAVFLFDPFISVMDLLPDALGYLCILFGLYRLADLDERIMDARKGIGYLALIGAARMVSLFLAFGLVSPTEQPVFILLILFTLGVLDCIVLVPMWKNLCGGLLYLGSRNDATVMFDRSRPRGRVGTRNMVERYTAFSAVYFILREALAILPEISVLSHEKGGVEVGDATRFYDFVGVYRLAGGAVSLILGLIWLALTIRFVVKLKSDAPFFARLAEKYTAEVLPRHDLFAMRAVKASLGCLLVAAVCSVDLYLDGVNVLPDTLTAIFLILSVVFLRRYAGKNLPALVAATAYGLTASLSWFLQLSYFSQSELDDVFRRDETVIRWQNSVLLQALASVLLLAAVALILRSLYAMVKRYTGVHAFRDDTGYAAERTEAIHTIIRKKLIAVGIFAILTALSTLFFWGVIPTLPEWELHLSGADVQTQNYLETFITTAYQILTDGYWFVDIILGGFWVAAIGAATGEISDQMEYSSMMR